MYSYGVILWELFTGLEPWQDKTPMQARCPAPTYDPSAMQRTRPSPLHISAFALVMRSTVGPQTCSARCTATSASLKSVPDQHDPDLSPYVATQFLAPRGLRAQWGGPAYSCYCQRPCRNPPRLNLSTAVVQP